MADFIKMYKLTKEQQDIIDTSINMYNNPEDNNLLKVSAVAGSSKSFTLTKIAEALPHTSQLYLAYNKAIATEAKENFPYYVDCKTTHSLAYTPIVKYGLDLEGNEGKPRSIVQSFSYRDIKEDIPYEEKLEVIKHLEAFFLSPYTSVKSYSIEQECDIPDTIEKLVSKYFMLMVTNKIPCTHSFYLKMYHILLAEGHIHYDKPFDLLMLDECVVARTGIKTSEGVLSIAGLYKKQSKGEELPLALSFNTTTDMFEYKPIVKVLSNGEKNVYDVKTSTKISLKGTATHKVLTQRGYVEISNLIPLKDYIISDTLDNLRISKLLNTDQLQIILGSYLGDGHLIQPKQEVNSYSLKFTQGIKQLDYLNWKMKAFGLTNPNLVKSGYTEKMSIYQSSQVSNFILDKDPFSLVIEELTPLGLAIWAMDGGSFNKNNNVFILHSNSFSFQQNMQLQEMLLKLFNISSAVVLNGKSHWQLHISEKSRKVFFDIIAPYIHIHFIQKWNLSIKANNYELDNNFLPYGASYVESVTLLDKKVKVYDLSILNNNNYITTSPHGTNKSAGLVVHNCGDINNVTLEIFKALPAVLKIMVGDPFQNIYSFNHTVNGFKALKNIGVTKSLSTSFRCSEEVADRVESFCQRYLDKDFVFKGIKHNSNIIKTEAIISRTNSGMIEYMIKLANANISFNLTRSPQEIFSDVLTLMNLKDGCKITSQGLKFIQPDVDTYFKSKTLPVRHKTCLIYINHLHGTEERSIRTAFNMIVTYGASKIYDAYKFAKQCDKDHKDHTLTLTTAHSSKGLSYDKVTIANDFDLDAIIEMKIDEMSPSCVEELRLYYVAISRARIKLIGAKYLT